MSHPTDDEDGRFGQANSANHTDWLKLWENKFHKRAHEAGP